MLGLSTKFNNENSKTPMDTINELKETIEKQATTVERYRKESGNFMGSISTDGLPVV